ncbi:MAG: ATP-binding protein [Solirubrobacteraceae bacterium]
MTACPYGECDGSGFVVDMQARTTRACRCRPQRIAAAKARRLSSVIPKRFAGVSFDRPPVTEIDPHVVTEVRRYVADLDEHLDAGRGLWLMGDVGTGKTTLAMLVSKATLERRRTVAIYSLPRLLSELRKTFSDSSDLSYLGLLDSLTSVDLLHLDDVGTERSNEWVLEQLYAIVNARYEEQRAIVLTTNLQPDALAEQITERTASRLTEMCGDPLPLFGEDNRKVVDFVPRPVGGSLRYGELPS